MSPIASVLLAILASLLGAKAATAPTPGPDPYGLGVPPRASSLVSRAAGGRITPHWMPDGESFWYAAGSLRDRVILVARPDGAPPSPLLDVERVRALLAEATGKKVRNEGLPFSRVELRGEDVVRFKYRGELWDLRLTDYELTRVPEEEAELVKRRTPGKIGDGFTVGSDAIMERPSPDGELLLRAEDDDLSLRRAADDQTTPLTEDGEEYWSWAADQGCWSPDGSRVAVLRADAREVPRVAVVDWLQESEEVEESRCGLGEKLEQIREEIGRKRREHTEALERVNAVKVELGEAEAHIENVITRASDEMGMDLLSLYEGYEHDDGRDWDAVAAEIRELRTKIERLGNVNLDAIAEQEELDQRREFLVGQLNDIEESRRRLNDLIRKINKESRELFLATFEQVRGHFQSLFRKLFGGGRADIVMIDRENVLESGIEIIARPPGKELRSLSLLSGGEKTMTALSLMFSIFKCRPSPFCLLDEVDAALDEQNTERFSRLVGEFVDTSQFLVISHAKRTMGMADVLYGVTMQEPGVSKRISVRFEDADRHIQHQGEPVGAS